MTFIVRTLLSLSLTGMAVAGCKKPDVRCTTAHGPYAVRFTKVEGGCPGAELTAGVIGVQSYIRADGDGISYENVPVALKAAEVGELVAEYGQNVDQSKLISLGQLSDVNVRSDGYCGVADPTPAELKLEARPATTDTMGKVTPALPAVDLRYQWSNVRFYVTAALPGTQFTADLVYTRNGCQARYKVQGLYPSASCGKTLTAADGTKSRVADPGACSACADPAVGRRFGSGISPDIDTVCDESAMICLPAKEVPSLRASPETCTGTSVVEPWPDAAPKDTAPAADTSSPAEAGDQAGAETGDTPASGDAQGDPADSAPAG